MEDVPISFTPGDEAQKILDAIKAERDLLGDVHKYLDSNVPRKTRTAADHAIIEGYDTMASSIARIIARIENGATYSLKDEGKGNKRITRTDKGGV